MCLVNLVHWIVVSANHSGQTCVAAPLSIMMCIVCIAPLFVVADLWSLSLLIMAMTWIGVISWLLVGGIGGSANGCCACCCLV